MLKSLGMHKCLETELCLMFYRSREPGYNIRAKNANKELSFCCEGVGSQAYFKVGQESINSSQVGDNSNVASQFSWKEGAIYWYWNGKDFGYGEHVTQMLPAT